MGNEASSSSKRGSAMGLAVKGQDVVGHVLDNMCSSVSFNVPNGADGSGNAGKPKRTRGRSLTARDRRSHSSTKSDSSDDDEDDSSSDDEDTSSRDDPRDRARSARRRDRDRNRGRRNAPEVFDDDTYATEGTRSFDEEEEEFVTTFDDDDTCTLDTDGTSKLSSSTGKSAPNAKGQVAGGGLLKNKNGGLSSSLSRRCYFTGASIGRTTQHYEALTLSGRVVLMLAEAMTLKGCPTICDEDLRRIEKRFPDLFSKLPEEILISSGWRRISKFCHFSHLPIPDGVPFFHSKERLHHDGGYYFLLASAVGMVRPIDVEPLTRDHLVVLETDYSTQCDAAPQKLLKDPTLWVLVDRFCFFSGGPINSTEDVYYQAQYNEGSPIYMLAFLSPSLSPEQLYLVEEHEQNHLEADQDENAAILRTVSSVMEVENVYDLTERDFDDLNLYHRGPCQALPSRLLHPSAWTKVFPEKFLAARQKALERARVYEAKHHPPIQEGHQPQLNNEVLGPVNHAGNDPPLGPMDANQWDVQEDNVKAQTEQQTQAEIANENSNNAFLFQPSPFANELACAPPPAPNSESPPFPSAQMDHGTNNQVPFQPNMHADSIKEHALLGPDSTQPHANNMQHGDTAQAPPVQQNQPHGQPLPQNQDADFQASGQPGHPTFHDSDSNVSFPNGPDPTFTPQFPNDNLAEGTNPNPSHVPPGLPMPVSPHEYNPHSHRGYRPELALGGAEAPTRQSGSPFQSQVDEEHGPGENGAQKHQGPQHQHQAQQPQQQGEILQRQGQEQSQQQHQQQFHYPNPHEQHHQQPQDQYQDEQIFNETEVSDGPAGQTKNGNLTLSSSNLAEQSTLQDAQSPWMHQQNAIYTIQEQFGQNLSEVPAYTSEDHQFSPQDANSRADKQYHESTDPTRDDGSPPSNTASNGRKHNAGSPTVDLREQGSKDEDDRDASSPGTSPQSNKPDQFEQVKQVSQGDMQNKNMVADAEEPGDCAAFGPSDDEEEAAQIDHDDHSGCEAFGPPMVHSVTSQRGSSDQATNEDEGSRRRDDDDGATYASAENVQNPQVDDGHSVHSKYSSPNSTSQKFDSDRDDYSDYSAEDSDAQFRRGVQPNYNWTAVDRSSDQSAEYEPSEASHDSYSDYEDRSTERNDMGSGNAPTRRNDHNAQYMGDAADIDANRNTHFAEHAETYSRSDNGNSYDDNSDTGQSRSLGQGESWDREISHSTSGSFVDARHSSPGSQSDYDDGYLNRNAKDLPSDCESEIFQNESKHSSRSTEDYGDEIMTDEPGRMGYIKERRSGGYSRRRSSDHAFGPDEQSSFDTNNRSFETSTGSFSPRSEMETPLLRAESTDSVSDRYTDREDCGQSPLGSDAGSRRTGSVGTPDDRREKLRNQRRDTAKFSPHSTGSRKYGSSPSGHRSYASSPSPSRNKQNVGSISSARRQSPRSMSSPHSTTSGRTSRSGEERERISRTPHRDNGDEYAENRSNFSASRRNRRDVEYFGSEHSPAERRSNASNKRTNGSPRTQHYQPGEDESNEGFIPNPPNRRNIVTKGPIFEQDFMSHDEYSTTPSPFSSQQENEPPWDSFSPSSTVASSVVSGNSSISKDPDGRNSRRALILKMAKARMNNKGDSPKGDSPDRADSNYDFSEDLD